ncbi:Uncharacterised protein [Chryseobacterium nakagawai]|uniref:Uncharacterized protein n=1 Tax=Chryseobacterium nakagawai TaxID=1241982 RepID=A0AAD1DQP0_CHRNA|nr:hypothetical protein [Chryseobacterium nakagawai]AZA90936.1 hypothetical protein EG343_09955 [Chryseobacterium nakagawai]VEH22474.1 Uncharacterised protein [Chryseobacterium nakagawai]
MQKFTINGQKHIIVNVIDALENNMMGMSVARSWNYELISETTIEFTLKEGETVKPSDLFWFGYFTAID